MRGALYDLREPPPPKTNTCLPAPNQVLEGERAQAKDNHLLGALDVPLSPPTLAGEPNLTLAFDLDANGLLTVTAEAQGTQRSLTLGNDRGRLSRDEIEAMVRGAQEAAAADGLLRAQHERRQRLVRRGWAVRSAARRRLRVQPGDRGARAMETEVLGLLAAVRAHEGLGHTGDEAQMARLEGEAVRAGLLDASLGQGAGRSGPDGSGPAGDGPAVEEVE